MSNSSAVSFDPNSFTLSDAAVTHLSKSLSNKDFLGIRFSVLEASGCSGYTYELDYVNEKGPEDTIFTFKDVLVYIDKDSFKFLKGTKIDFSVDGANQGLKFLNPNVKAVCGCGESFEVDI